MRRPAPAIGLRGDALDVPTRSASGLAAPAQPEGEDPRRQQRRGRGQRHIGRGEGDRLAALAEAQSGFAADLVRPLARAWAAMARQNWAKALEELVPVMSQTERLGGSRAQRDLIELAYVQVLLKLGQTDEARRSLMTRRQVLATAPPVAAMH